MRKILTILWLFISVSIAAQTTYYVAATGGDNGNPGTSGSPWATLAYAVTQVSTTDTIFMQAGTHTINTTVNVPISVSLKGAGATSIITTSSLTAEWTPVINMVSISVVDGAQSISYLKFDGASLTGAMALWIARRHNVKIHNCWFDDWNYCAVYWTGDGGNETTEPTNYVTGSEFYNDTITNSSSYASDYARGALYVGGHAGMLIHNNYITQTGRTAGQNGWPVKFWANGGWMKGCKLYDNYLFKDDLTYWDFSLEGLWIYGMEAYNNTMIGSLDLNHVQKGDYDYGLWAHDNTFGPENNTALNYTGIVLEFNQDDLIIEKNTFRNCYRGLYYTPRSGSTITNNRISYNLFDDLTNNGWGIMMWGETENEFTIGAYSVFNNVFYSNGADKATYGVGFSGAENGTISLVNNIFVNFSSYYGIFRWGDNWDEVNIQNNIMYGNGGSNLPNFYSSEFPPSYTNSDNIIDNPDFTTPGSDFTLQLGSPAIDAGLGVGLTTDILGNVVGDSPDIGAYEYDSDPPDPPGLPEVTTTEITVYTVRYATGAGNVTSDGGGTITSRGVCWSTSANPTTASSKFTSGGTIGAFSGRIYPLKANTTYHYRSFAVNESGTSYGADQTFTTPVQSVNTTGGKYLYHNGKLIISK